MRVSNTQSYFLAASHMANAATNSHFSQKEILIRQCQQIVGQSRNGIPRRSSAWTTIPKEAVTNYLIFTGTPLAMEVLDEFERAGWGILG